MRAITRPRRPAFHFSPVFSPDGHHVTYAACDAPGLNWTYLLPGRCAVGIVEIDESFAAVSAARTLTTQPAYQHPGRHRLEPRRQSIVFVGKSAGPARTSGDSGSTDARPGASEIAGSHAEHPTTVASRDRLVFSRSDWDGHLYRFTAGLPPERVAASSSFEGDPTSPRTAAESRLPRNAPGASRSGWPRPTGHSHASSPPPMGMAGSPNWSPDGRTIAFDADDPDGHVHIWTIPAEGGAPRHITTATRPSDGPTWSRDGTWIYFSETTSRRARHLASARDGRTAQRLTRTGTGFLAYETADGTSLLYQPKYGDSPLLVMPLTGAGPPRRSSTASDPAALVPLPEARRLRGMRVERRCRRFTQLISRLAVIGSSARSSTSLPIPWVRPSPCRRMARRSCQRACASRRRPDADRKFPVRH